MVNLHIHSTNSRYGTTMDVAEGHTNRICNFLPVACANFFNVANDGPLWPEAKLPSMRVIAVALVPMRSATCAWVSPAFLRAASISSSKANSSSIASYSALNAGSSIHFAAISSCDIFGGIRLPVMLYLLHSGFGLLTFSAWCLLGFLDEAVQHDDAFTRESAVKHTSNAITAFDSKLKKPATERTCMWLAKITTVDLHAFNEMLVPSSHTHRQLVDLKSNLFAVVLNSVFHTKKYNNIVMFSQGPGHLNFGRYSSRTATLLVVGRCNPELIRAHDRVFAVFLCAKHCHIRIMVGRAGQSKGWPGSRVTGIATPTRLTAHGRCSSGDEFNYLSLEVVIMASTPALATSEIILVEGRAVTTSLAVAAYFTKCHADVIRKIESIECSPEFTERNFALSEHFDTIGRKLPCHEITRDGFVFLAMGFTGKRAAIFKENYIEALNRMEAQSGTPAVSCRSRVVLTLENGVVVSFREITPEEHICSVEIFLEIAERQGYLIIHADLSLGRKKRGDA